MGVCGLGYIQLCCGRERGGRLIIIYEMKVEKEQERANRMLIQ